MNDQTRAFSKRFAARMKNGAPPTMVQAGVYAGLIHYFKALEALGGNPHDGVKVVEKMKSMPTDDPLFGKGEIQPNGRTIHSAYLFEVEEAVGIQGPVGFLQADRHGSGRPGVHAAVGKQVRAGEEVTGHARRPRAGEAAYRVKRDMSAKDRSYAGSLRTASGGTDQRLVLRAAQPRARRDLRHAQHHQFRPRRALHDGRVLRLFPAQRDRASATGRR